MEKTNKKREILCLFSFAVISAFLILLFSTTTSPLYKRPLSGDSVIFQVIGKFWAEGSIPYKTLWDLKGPVIFLVNAIGYYVFGSETGVFIIQILNCTIILMIMFVFLGKRQIKKYLTGYSLICVLYFFVNYDSGNLTEEYCMPWLLLSLCLQCEWIFENSDSEVSDHNLKYTVLYGAGFAVCLLTRVTNALPICVGALFIAVCLLIKGNIKNLLGNIAAFLVGSLIVLVPFIIYFWIHGALHEAVYGTVLYNIGYSQASSFHFEPSSLRSFVMYFGGYAPVLVGIYTFFRSDRKAEGAFIILITGSIYLWLMFGKGFRHYNMLLFPGVFAALEELIRLKTLDKRRTELRIFMFCLIAASIIGTAYNCRLSLTAYKDKRTESIPWGAEQLELITRIPEEDYDSFIGYDVDPGLYLESGIKPCYKYFVLQEFEIQQNKSILPLILEDYNTLKAKWILIPDGEYSIQDILDQHYEIYSTLKYEKHGRLFKLYKLKEER